MTGADRAWAAQYREGDVIRYTKGSYELKINPGEYGTVKEVHARQNTLKVELADRSPLGRSSTVEYDPKRLRGVGVYEKAERSFSEGDRIQLTAPNKAERLANRELGTVDGIHSSGQMKVRMDSGRTAMLDSDKALHVDHGYALTSHSAQGATADRVIVHAESGQSAALVNERFAYVAGSRMRDGLDVYTDNSQGLTTSLERQFDKSAAVRDKDVAPRLGHGESGQRSGTDAATGRGEGQGQSTRASSTGQGLGQGR
jgi:ATP-dependent exoDNAse (exonuclease V) alpha subunit